MVVMAMQVKIVGRKEAILTGMVKCIMEVTAIKDLVNPS
jgi:hypothetical protein